jgi:uncharacterized protein (TIGR02594 family)
MAITRIVTDVPDARVGFVIAINQAAGGVLVSREDEGDGEFTLTFEFPDPGGLGARPLASRATAAAASGGGAAAPAAAVPAPAGPPSARWLAAAEAEIGTGEAEGTADNPRIVAFHASTDGGAEPDSVPWCSSFVNFCVQQAGLEGTRSKAARSWIEWGRASEFVPGAVVVLKRGAPPKGHVGFFVGTENGRILLLGGNQGNRVGIASFDPSIVLACRIAP